MTNQHIAGYGYLFFEDIHKAAGLSNAFGPIEIESLSGIRVMATERIASSERTSAYFEGVDADAAGRTVVLPYSGEKGFRTNLGTITQGGNAKVSVHCSTRMACAGNSCGHGASRGLLSSTVSMPRWLVALHPPIARAICGWRQIKTLLAGAHKSTISRKTPVWSLAKGFRR